MANCKKRMNCTFCLGKIRTINILGCIQGIYVHNYDGDGDGDFLDDHAGGDDNGDYQDVGMYICEVSVCSFPPVPQECRPERKGPQIFEEQYPIPTEHRRRKARH